MDCKLKVVVEVDIHNHSLVVDIISVELHIVGVINVDVVDGEVGDGVVVNELPL